jgi:hypothetical protein
MELIPILSTIILVATISTFILAIGAYILYKVREAKGQHTSYPPQKEVHGELITPSAAPQQQEKTSTVRAPGRTTFVERQPIFVQQRQPMSSRYNPQPQQYKVKTPVRGPEYASQKRYTGQGYAHSSEQGRKYADARFLKYTKEGYIDTKDDKNSGELKWR